MKKELFLILNPGSRSGRSLKTFKYIFQLLDAVGKKYEYAQTNSLDDAYELSRQANLQNYETIVAVGGDGTINQVLNGFYDCEGHRISQSCMAIIYTGTSPDFCKNYNIPYNNIQKSIEAILNNQTREVVIGKIRLNKEQAGEQIVRYFGCCVNIGMGASVARNANSGIRKYLGDFGGTFVALIRTLFTYKPVSMEIEIDGKLKSIHRLYNLFIGRTKFVASGIQVANELTDQDSKLYILSVSDLKFSSLPSCLLNLYNGKSIKKTSIMELVYCNEITIPLDNQCPEVEFDGDPQGFLPCTIGVAADKLKIIVEQA